MANPKTRSSGIEYRIDKGVKAKFVQGSFTREKKAIAERQIIIVKENLSIADLTEGSFLLVNKFSFLFSQMMPNIKKNPR